MRDTPDKTKRPVSETGKENDLGHESGPGGKAQGASAGASFLGVPPDDGLASVSGGPGGQSQENP